MESTSLWHAKSVRTVLLAVGMMAVVALGAYTYLALQQASFVTGGPVTISVSGEGEIVARPDIGSFSFSVRAEADTAEVAQSQAAEQSNAIIAYLKEAGVAEADIKTQSYNLNPKYRYEERFCTSMGYCPPGERVQDGYEVSQYVTVKVRDLDQAGALVSGVGERGASNISGLSFTIDDPDVLKAEARAAAIADAEEKAKVLAADLGVRIVRLAGFYENGGEYPMYGYGGDMMERSVMTMDAKAEPELPTGESTVRTTVNLIFEVR